MLGRFYENQDCSAARALELVGERWSLLILRDAVFRGFTRFSDFQRALDIAPNILASRLEGFVASGIMELRRSDLHADRNEYRMTEKGNDLKPIIMAMSAWGAKWIRPGRMIYTHKNCRDCGQVEIQLRCAACGSNVGLPEIEVSPRQSPAQ